MVTRVFNRAHDTFLGKTQPDARDTYHSCPLLPFILFNFSFFFLVPMFRVLVQPVLGICKNGVSKKKPLQRKKNGFQHVVIKFEQDSQ